MGILCTFWHLSIVRLFNSFEYQKISLYDALGWHSLYHSTISKSWLQDLSAWIFELPNKSPSFKFWLHHSANEMRLNVYVPHSLDKQWLKKFELQTIVLNDRILDRKTKIKFLWRTGSSKIHGLHQESKSDQLTKKIKKSVVERKRTLGLWPRHDPSETRFVVHINLSLG